MTKVKKHCKAGLIAYFLKKGRSWWVESAGKKEKFDIIEAIVKKHPVLLEIEAIKNSVKRREISRTSIKAEVNLTSLSKSNIIETKNECYYCNGSGLAGGLPCSNCKGTGMVRVTAELS